MEKNCTLALFLLLVSMAAGGCNRAEEGGGQPAPEPSPYQYPSSGGNKVYRGPMVLNEPPLSADPGHVDFGRIFDRDTVTKKFSVTNAGKKTLTLIKVETSCGCTAATPLVGGKAITLPYGLPPGKTLKLPVALDPRGRSGKQNQWVELMSNNLTRPLTRIKIEAEILQEVGLESYLFFGVVSRGKAVTRTIQLTGYPPDKLRVTGVESSSPYVTVEVGRPKPPGRKGDPVAIPISVTLAANTPSGRIEQDIWVKTNSSRFPRKKVFVLALIRGLIDVNPYRLRITVGSRPRATVSLTSRKVKVEVLEVRCTIPYLSWKLHPRRGNNQSVLFELSSPPKDISGLVRGSIEIKTNSTERPTITIPVILDFGQPKKD